MEILESGIIQYVSKTRQIATNANALYESIDSGESWDKICTLPISPKDKLLSKNRWLARLSRNEISHIIEVNRDLFACFGFGEIYLLDLKTRNVEKIGTVKGSRPLKVCSVRKNIYYGVYTNNAEREPIELYRYDVKSKRWDTYYTFNTVRHIHGVFWGEFENKLWTTTGDLDEESTVWRFDENDQPEKIATGSQQTRAVDLLFTKSAVFYATDAPNEPNYIYRLDRKTEDLKKLQEVGGPVFYARKEGYWIFFGTVVEPSEINRTDAVELWGSKDEGNSWKKIKEFKKDIGHMKLFQYGQIKFPSGPGDGKYLYFTPYATEHDHKVIRYPLDEL